MLKLSYIINFICVIKIISLTLHHQIKTKTLTIKKTNIMSEKRKNQLSEVFTMAWQFVKQNGFTLSEALKCAWANIKLRAKMHMGIVEFFYKKVDGSMRQAFGTLKADRIPQTSGENKRKPNANLFTYFDTEKNEWRCFKRFNLSF